MKATNPSSAGATEATTKLWDTVMEGVKQENRTHAPVDFDTALGFHHHLSRRGLYRERSGKIVGLQTEAPLKRAIIPFGGIKMVEGSCKAYNRELDPMLKKSSQSTVKLTTRAFSTSIPRTSCAAVNPAC